MIHKALWVLAAGLVLAACSPDPCEQERTYHESRKVYVDPVLYAALWGRCMKDAKAAGDTGAQSLCNEFALNGAIKQ